ncbi:hypothetical protein [Variovorax sp. PBL-E5]|uniref:hypothetical protein n=1 Tax=Variovorax sp. PBL-E5 TaxID=434014 RepID=UPI0013199A71|nr:hypothetical protein [Variovorax sp. PBL-E5]VTU36185.1 hypothetical protein E5CHR_04250 [Variovorax sp. PBL-E5]
MDNSAIPHGAREVILDQPRWSTKIWSGVTFDQGQNYHGDVFRGLLCLCHISLSGNFVDEAAGQKAVAASALKWIDAFENRDASYPRAF